MTRDDLLEALQSNNVQAFLRVIRAGETSQLTDAYQTIYGGSHFESFADHPRQKITAGGYTSTAAGAYQFLSKTWDGLVKQYGFPDFTPQCQDEGAVALIAGRKALDDVYAGRIPQAIAKCAREWASLPGSPYGQPTRTLAQALETYSKFGGVLAASADSPAPLPQEVKPVAPIVIPLLSALSSALPALAKMFSSGSEVAERNIAAGTMIAEKLVQVTNSVNLQEAAEKIQSDPALQQAAKEAVDEVLLQLQEVGGGIAEARKASLNTEGDWRKVFVSVPMVVILLLMPIVYFVVYHVITGASWSAEIKASVVSAIISGVLFAIVGFALGTSYGSAKKDAVIAGGK